MGKVVTFHSYRGGTGKTVSSLTLAALYAKMGKNVCLLDVDFKAPSLHIVFKDYKKKRWLNDFLDGHCEKEDALEEFSDTYATKGNFMVGLANPRTTIIKDYLTKERKWQMDALRRLLALTKFLKEELKMDYIFIDSSPGIAYSSLNAIVASDLTVMVTTTDRSDITGSNSLLNDFNDLFAEKTFILVNKVITNVPCSIMQEEDINKYLIEAKQTFPVPILGIIPCYCDVNKSRATGIFVLENPDHPFTKAFEKIANRLDRL
ncbi:MAG: MinD/ParA family ATP-binding protein [archaeon]